MSALNDLEKGPIENLKYSLIKDILNTEIGQSAESSVKKAFTRQITVKKRSKKGTYKIKVTVTAAGNDKYLAGTKTVEVSVKVK